jgi:hypothetical protein
VPGARPPGPASDGDRDDTGERSDDRTPGWARRELAREVDRARDPLASGPVPKSTANLTEGWRALEQRARRGLGGAADPGAGPSGLKRPLKRAMFRALGPVVRRYDALIAELAAYGASLAERVEETEAEVVRLRERLEGISGAAESARSGSDPEPSETDPS